MASMLFFIIIALLSLIAGLVLIAIGHVLSSMLVDYIRKKRVPKTKEEMAIPPKELIDKREVENDEQRRFNKFREFEKLRRLGEGKKTGTISSDPSRIEQLQEFGVLPNERSEQPNTDPQFNDRPIRKVKLDD